MSRAAPDARAVAAVLSGAWRAEPPAEPVDPGQVEAAMPLLLRTGCAALASWRLREADLPPALRKQLRDAARVTAMKALAHEQAIPQIVSRLEAAGARPVLVKGWAIARQYPQRGLRPYGDVDLCVDPASFRRAEAVIAALPPDFPEVDLHAGYPKLYDRRWPQLAASARIAALGETAIGVLAPEEHLRLLAFHMLHHGAWRPLWLCDVAVGLETRGEDFDWDLCLRGSRRMAGVIRCALGLAHNLLGARLEGVPEPDRVAALPAWVPQEVLAQWERGEGATTLPPLGLQVARGSTGLASALHARWRNPIQATVELRAPFNGFPRLPIQIASMGLRIPDFLRQLIRSARM